MPANAPPYIAHVSDVIPSFKTSLVGCQLLNPTDFIPLDLDLSVNCLLETFLIEYSDHMVSVNLTARYPSQSRQRRYRRHLSDRMFVLSFLAFVLSSFRRPSVFTYRAKAGTSPRLCLTSGKDSCAGRTAYRAASEL